MKIIAVVIWFNPTFTEYNNLGRLLSQFDEVILVDNSPCEAKPGDYQYPQSQRCIVVQNANRGGIARALNVGAELALNHRAEYIAFFDQDTNPPEDFRVLMESRAGRDHANYLFPLCVDLLKGHEIKTAVIRRFWFHKVFKAEGKVEDARIVLTSGSVISAACLEAVGKFREEFFIDHVDTDFCIRLIRMKLGIHLCNEIIVQHALGNLLNDTNVRQMLKPYNYSPIRTYFRVRNTTVLILENLASIPGVALFLLRAVSREFIAVLLFECQKYKKVKAFFLGWLHGMIYIISGRMPVVKSEELL